MEPFQKQAFCLWKQGENVEKEIVNANSRINTSDDGPNESTPSVEESVDYEITRLDRFLDKTPLKANPRIGGTRADKRQACRRQVYTTMEIAETSATKLRKFGIAAKIERCKVCGFLHVLEAR